MATKKEERQAQSMEQIAADYRALMLQVKELEKQAAPLKKSLTDYASAIGVLTLELGNVMLEKRVTVKGAIDDRRVTPDWLYRAQCAGLDAALSIGIDIKAVTDDMLVDGQTIALLDEVGFTQKEAVTYAVRI